MPNIVCPTCATKLEIDDDMIGQDVQCGSCQQIFKAETETKRSSRRGEADEDETPRKSKYRKDEDGDDDDERPSKRRRSKARDDDDDDENDYEDRSRGRRGSAGESSGMGIASLVLGIIGLLGSCCCLFGIADILAIIFGILSLKTPGKGMGIGGLITGSIGLLIIIGLVIFRMAVGGAGVFGGFGGGGAGGGGGGFR